MDIVMGSDHGGFELKEKLKSYLQNKGYSVMDFGTYREESCDYPDYALLVAQAISDGEYKKGILVDGTGGGVSLTANKVKGVRAVTAYNRLTGSYASEHDDCNVLCLGGKMLGELVAKDIVDAWLDTPFGGARHQRRLNKVEDIERKYFK
ncbi:MAG: ribose 5-phosphate isomerase B [Elusimicrobia bacterium]|jgi:ribose 5-phosphate isomerase B|nr:ribose 5-phosphate isomerase B [Elusimicrobiota bacterium]